MLKDNLKNIFNSDYPGINTIANEVDFTYIQGECRDIPIS